MLFTWPSSQPFIGIEGCILILPPEEDVKGTLDSAYMVPTEVAEKVGRELTDNGQEVPLPETESLYTMEPLTEGKKGDYMDYNGNIFVAEQKKFPLTVVFGETASNRAGWEGTLNAIEAINKGEIDGSYNTYEFTTEQDRDTCIRMLQTHSGWLDNYFEKK